MKSLYLSKSQVACFANDNDAYIPELWANEGLAILEENMVIANLVHRDFEDEIRNFGDVVNTRKPGTFRISRKKDGTTLTQQDANSTNVPVMLDQWFYTSFVIKDGEASKSFQDLVDIYLRPGMQSIARAIDRAVLGRVHAFLGAPADRAGRLQNLTSSNAKDYVLDAREILNVNKAPQDGRSLILAPASETALLKTDLFIKADERGDGGNALTNAQLGRILGFTTYMDQNTNAVSLATVYGQTHAGTITNALAAGGSGSQACTITGYEILDGEFVVVAGNDQPTYATAATHGAGDTTAVTLNEVNKYATLASAVVTVYEKCAVKGGYAKYYSEAIVVDGWTVAPQVGQLVAFGTSTDRRTYTVIESWLSAGGEQSLLLDRPLEVALVNDDACWPGPAGVLNIASHRDALALVTRPLATPQSAMGVMSHVGQYNGISMRVTMQYDIQEGGTVVNLDILAGVAVLDTDLAVVLLG